MSMLQVLEEQLFRFFSSQYRIELVQNGADALLLTEELQLAEVQIPVIICDHYMPDMDGATLLEKVNSHYPEILQIIITSQTDVSYLGRVVNNANLFGHIPNPWKETDVYMVVKEALRRYEHEKTIRDQTQRLELLYQQAKEEIEMRKKAQEKLELALEEIKALKQPLEEQNIYLKKRFQMESGFQPIIGKSEAIQYVLYRMEKVAPGDTTVLILGETGTGKELIALAIHSHSHRREQPLIKINCAALPKELIESELFGHEKGAFTGAHAQKIGKFELADGGTLFLDEIGELPLNLQAKILRAIESDEIERLGGMKTIKIDVRIITATNRNLEKEVKEGNFRKDLYYRLNVYPITLPPLRRRKEDIGLLVNYFVEILNKKIGRRVTNIPRKTLDSLIAYDWPGNVRELENILERGIILSQGRDLNIELPDGSKLLKTRRQTLEEVEKEAIINALSQTNGKISGNSGAASYLDINASTLRSKMKKLGIGKESVWNAN